MNRTKFLWALKFPAETFMSEIGKESKFTHITSVCILALFYSVLPRHIWCALLPNMLK